MLSLLAPLCAALTAVAPSLSLDEAVSAALQAQPLLEAHRQHVRSAQAELRRQRAINYPKIALTAQALGATNNASSADFLSVDDVPRLAGIATSSGVPTAGSPDYQPRFNSLVALGAHYRLLDFGHSTNTVAAAQSELRASDSSNKQGRQDVIFGVARSFFRLVAAQQSLEVATASEKRAKQHSALAEAGVQAGLRPRIDIIRSDAESAACQLALIEAKNAVQTHRRALDIAIGWAPRPYTATPSTSSILSGDANCLSNVVKALDHRLDLRAHVAEEQAAAPPTGGAGGR
jgi:outer membrane protein TolC